MKKRLQHICSAVILLALIAGGIACIGGVLESKDSYKRFSAFFAEENDIDVMFFGASHVQDRVFVQELWKDYGINAYNMSGSGCTIPILYWTVVNTLDYKTPKVIVFDVFDMWPGRKIGPFIGQIHQQFDAFPMTLN